MKKYLLLTSILALAACGGGSGGGGGSHGGPGAPVLPDIPDGMRSAISTENASSNEVVTKMKSEVVVADKGGKSYLARTPMAIVGADGYTFTSYRLDDVKFFAADADTTNDGYLNLGINENGKIDSMYMVVGGNGARPDQAIARDGETSTFKAPIFEYVRDVKAGEVNFESQTPEELNTIRNSNHWSQKGYWYHNEGTNKYEYWKLGDEAVYRTVGVANYDALTALESSKHLSGGHWNRTDEVMPVVTYGKNIDGHGTSLQYSDFGHFNPVYENKRVYLNGGSGDVATGWTHDASKSGTYKENDKFAEELAAEDYQLFAGGYAIKGDGTMTGDRPSLEPVIGATYKGMAIGRVYTSIHGGNSFADKKANATAYGVEFDPAITENDFNEQEIGRDIAKKFTTYDATMKITQSGDQVVQTLNMPFYTHSADANKFYDITIAQTGNGNPSVTFRAGANNYSDTDPLNAIESKYRMYDAGSHWDMEHATFEPGYYGVNTPSEAAGTAAIRAGYDIANGGERDYEVQAAWGMIKQ